MKKTLIIGNGFDLNNHLKSGYSDFKNWLKKNNEKILKKINYLEEYKTKEVLWSDLESAWAKYNKLWFKENKEKIMKKLIEVKVIKFKYYIEYNRDSNQSLYIFEFLPKILDILKTIKGYIGFYEMNNNLLEWIKSLKIDIKEKNTNIWKYLKNSEKIINFNYTSYLSEKLGYEVFYIHVNDIGSIKIEMNQDMKKYKFKNNTQLIFGGDDGIPYRKIDDIFLINKIDEKKYEKILNANKNIEWIMYKALASKRPLDDFKEQIQDSKEILIYVTIFGKNDKHYFEWIDDNFLENKKLQVHIYIEDEHKFDHRNFFEIIYLKKVYLYNIKKRAFLIFKIQIFFI